MGVEVEKVPCWYVVCDECGSGDGEHGDCSIHYASRREAVEGAQDADFQIDGDRALCLDCWETKKDGAAEQETGRG